MKKKITTLLIAMGVVATVALPAKALCQQRNGENTAPISSPGSGYVGVKRFFGGSKTHGFSWIHITNANKTIYTRLQIGEVKYNKTWGKGFAQSDQKSQPGEVDVYEYHG